MTLSHGLILGAHLNEAPPTYFLILANRQPYQFHKSYLTGMTSLIMVAICKCQLSFLSYQRPIMNLTL